MISSADYPILLMPVKLETRFVTVKYREQGKDDGIAEKFQLWVRIFPDKIFLDGFDPYLSVQEIQDRNQYFSILNQASPTSETPQLNGWRILVSKYGVYRASWLLKAPEKYTSSAKEKKASEFRFRWLPDYFRLYLYENSGDSPLEFDLATINRSGLKILVNQRDWLTDFDLAVDLGMAIKADLPRDIDRFEKIIAVGLRKEEGTLSAAGVKELLHSHLHKQGFSFVDYGTPTNNLDGTESGHSSREEFDTTASFRYAVQGNQLEPPPLGVKTLDTKDRAKLDDLLAELNRIGFIESETTSGQLLAKSMGFDVNDFKYVKNSDKTEPRLNHLVQKATWFALGGKTLDALFGENLDNKAHETIWRFYAKYVRNRGPVPAVKIGNLPYGILPVTHIRDIFREINIPNDGTPQQKMELILAKLFEVWLDMARNRGADNFVPRLPDAEVPDEELARILSMEPTSSYLQLRLLELERLNKVLTRRFENPDVFPVPQNMFSYPPKLVDELLKDDPAYDRDLSYANEAYNELKNLIGDFLPKEAQTKYAPLLAFIDAGSASFEDLQIPILGNGQAEGPEDDWYKRHFLTLVTARLKGEQPVFYESKDGKPTNLPFGGYPGKTNFLLIDLLNESYYNARSHYDRVVCFQPSKKEVDGILSYKISLNQNQIDDLVGQQVAKGHPLFHLIGSPHGNIPITAPFSGKIEHIFLKPGEKLGDDRKLFHIRDTAAVELISKEMAALQAQIILEIEKLRAEGEDFVEAQKKALLETLDLNSFRLDAWMTGLAWQRIDELRQTQAESCYFGAYGWVENLKRSDPLAIIDHTNPELPFVDENSLDGGIIHAPSSSQAVAAAAFRQSFSTYQDDPEKVNPFTLNLTSDRIQKGSHLMTGIRQGHQLEALLGYRFERFIRDHHEQHGKIINELRKEFPLTINKLEKANGSMTGIPTMTVVNGLQLQKNYKGTDQTVSKGIELIEDMLDSSADILLYEAGFQMLRSNFSQAAAAMDAAKGEIQPPEAAALKTRLSGYAQQHKLMMFFEPSEAPGAPGSNPKAFIEPRLENWLKKLVGDLGVIACPVVVYRQEGKEKVVLGRKLVGLDELNIGALDFLHLALNPMENDSSELEQRIVNRFKEKSPDLQWDEHTFYEIGSTVPVGKQSLKNAVEVIRAGIHPLLREARPLKRDDLLSAPEEEASPTYHQPDLDALRNRLEACILQLNKSDIPVEILAKYDLENAKGIFLDDSDNRKQKSRTEGKQKAVAAQKLLDAWNSNDPPEEQMKKLEAVAKKLFGRSFLLLYPVVPGTTFMTRLKVNQDLLVGTKDINLSAGLTGGQERIRHWLEGRAEVSPQTEAFSDFLMITEHWEGDNPAALTNPYLQNWDFRIAQFTNGEHFPWLALNAKEMDRIRSQDKYKDSIPSRPDTAPVYPDNGESIVVFQPHGQNAKDLAWYGLLIDQFAELIPEKKVNTGLAFQYNAPNNEAPQAFLIAAPSDQVKALRRWEIEALRDIVNDTIDLTKVRMVDTDALQRFGFALPMAHWFNIPNII